eukprot:CAMPEP_0118906418 /NCGR_PEP_ID=MMETSP1166-20130328/10139_1 /TAXON_ID=1104430 /ORGANISM="Chrysoreinhardia sp, Strain CCMP3193" /LENGTH=1012 /DNA_ID=CAMNT_0006845727 /DNA_START=18 /DNA_END=3056 /DNA_ORIENTATION=-
MGLFFCGGASSSLSSKVAGVSTGLGMLWGMLYVLGFQKKAVKEWLSVHAQVAKLLVKHELEAQAATKLAWRDRLRRFGELVFLCSIERVRLLEVARARRLYPEDSSACYRLNPLKHVRTHRQLSQHQKSPKQEVKDMMMKHARAASVPVVREVVLVGGGHAHVHVVRMLGMEPVPGVRVTLISKDIETPYSGMLPGHVAGFYSRDECHVDLQKLARFARVRVVKGEVVRVDWKNKKVLFKGDDRPPVPYDVLSLNVGITPDRVTEAVTPVKPIAKFSKAWDDLLETKIKNWGSGSLGKNRRYDVVVVGGGAGGVELALAMRNRVREELRKLGKSPDLARFSLLTRGDRILSSHSEGVRICMERALRDRQVEVVANCEALEVKESLAGGPLGGGGGGHGTVSGTPPSKKTLACRFAWAPEKVRELPFDECIWCTQAAAPWFLRSSGLATDDAGFLRVDEFQRVGLAASEDEDQDAVLTKSRAELGIFAVGDCATVDGYPRPKAGVFAVMAGMALYQNVVAKILEQPLTPHFPQKSFLGLVGLGDGDCVASRGLLAFQAPWLWDLKDWIDRKWMWQYTHGLPDLTLADDDPADIFESMTPTSSGESSSKRQKKKTVFDAAPGGLELLKKSPMRCGGCGAKVGATTLARAMSAMPRPPPRSEKEEEIYKVLVGVDAPDDGAVVAYNNNNNNNNASGGTPLIHSVDFFRSFADDPYLLGRVAANHALSDCEAMGAKPATALAIAVLPYGSDRVVEHDLLALMRGVRKTLDDAGCELVGGHTCEGSEMSVGLSVTGVVVVDPKNKASANTDAATKQLLSKGGLRPGDVLVLTKALGTGCILAADMRAKASWPAVEKTYESMLQSNKAAADVLASHDCSACTDVTGFGLVGHLAEMCRASEGAAVDLDLKAVPLLPTAQDLAAAGLFSSLQPDNLRAKRAVKNHSTLVAEASPVDVAKYSLLFDPQTAGGLLATVNARDAHSTIHRLKAAGFQHAAIIGNVASANDPNAFPASITVRF